MSLLQRLQNQGLWLGTKGKPKVLQHTQKEEHVRCVCVMPQL